MSSIYDVTLIGSNLPFTKSRKIANSPQEAIEAALGATAENVKTAIKYLCTGEATLQAHPEFQKIVNARVAKVKTSAKERESINYYCVNVEFLNKAKKTENTVATRLSLEEYFKKEAEKERERQLYAINKFSPETFEAFVKENSLINYKKKLEKEGKSPEDVKKEVAKEQFRKKSTDYKEMLMQAKGVSNNYEEVDVKNYNAVLEALMNNACMVLAKKQGGGVTGYFCTGNLDIMAKLYGKQDFYTILQLTTSYQDFLNVTKRKVDIIKAERQAPDSRIVGKTSIKVASCDIRLKEVIDGRTKQPKMTASGQVQKKISSLEYQLVYENLLCMVKFKDVVKPNQNVIQILNTLATDENAPKELISETFGFNFEAWECAKIMYAIRMGTYTNVQKFGAKVDTLLAESAKANGISDEDLALYKQTKMIKQAKDFDYFFEKLQTGYCMSIIGSKEANIIDN